MIGFTILFYGVARRNRGNPAVMWKNCYRNMMLSQKALYLATIFSKILKQQFSIEFSSKFSTFSQKFQKHLFFSSKQTKINPCFKLFDKYVKIMHFSNFRKKFFKISKIPRPLRGDPKSVLQEPKFWLPHCLYAIKINQEF